MDGNGRWAKKRGLPRVAGHREGVNAIKKIIKAAEDLGVKALTFYTFSTENWLRPKQEIGILMNLLKRMLAKELATMHKRNIRFMTIGRSHPVPKDVMEVLKKAQNATKNNTGLIVNLAFNYGGRAEIIDAVKALIKDFSSGKIKLDKVNENTFSSFLYTHDLSDPDLLIRTSGEMRTSNFLPWQLAYSEFYFTKKLWPDFKKKDFVEAIKEYQKRSRRFGAL